MASFGDNILMIDSGVYGKDVRQAIKENIEIDHKAIKDLVFEIVNLQSRVDALTGGGGGSDPGGGGGTGPSSFSSAYDAALVVGAAIMPMLFASDATPI